MFFSECNLRVRPKNLERKDDFRESTMGFVISMGIAMSYYVMLTMALMVQQNEKMYPHLLVWIPNVLIN